MRKRFFLLALFLALALPVLSFATNGEDSGLNVCDLNNDGVRNLSDVSLYASCVDTFDVNGDSVHDLTDASLYASNNQNNSWCQTNFNCTANVMTNSSYISSTNQAGLEVCDINNDGVRNLSDVSLYAVCAGTFDVNGDGIHDLTDISLYSSNNQNNSWCQSNFRCTSVSGTDLTITDITNYPVIPKVGEDVYISMLILNSGSTVLTNTAGILNNYKYFQDFTAGMPDVIPTILATNPLNPGEVTHITWKGHFTSAGAKSLQATVDNANELAESNENNNNYSTTINVSSETALAVCDLNYDGVSDLRDVPLFANCQSTFDVNNDGVHNLTDISLYSSNHQSSSWCRANFRCEPSYNRYGYPGYRMSLDKSSYTTEDTAILTLEPFVMGSSHSVDLYGRVNPVGGESSKFLIRADINVDSSLDIPISLRGFARSSDTIYEYSLLLCSATNGCVMGSTNSMMITILAGDSDGNDDLPVITEREYYSPSDVNMLLTNLKQNRNTEEEAKYRQLVLDSGKKFAVNISENYQNQAAIFVAYGIDDSTKNFGSGERQAILADYFDTTGYANIKWDDISRLANGEKIVGRNLAKEQAQVARALKTFEAVYGHKPNFKDAKEDLFWNTLMYRIRFDRDLAKEKVGIAKFQQIFGKTPTTPYDWSVVRALGYIK